MKGKKLEASFTVEASFVMFTVFVSIALCLFTAFSLHDKVLAKMILEESVELWSHREDGETPPLEENGALSCLFSGEEARLSLRGDRDSGNVSGTAEGRNFRFEEESRHIRTEKLMRTLTLLEGLSGGQQNEDTGE